MTQAERVEATQSLDPADLPRGMHYAKTIALRVINMRAENITFIGLLVAVLVSGGYVLYMIGRALPIPGGKLLVMAPYLALIMFIAGARLRSPWTMTIVSVIFGAVISIFTPFMGAAILASGLLSDLSGRLIPGSACSVRRAIVVAAFYPAWAFVIALLVSNYLTGNVLFGSAGAGLLILGTVLAHLLGLGGAIVGVRVQARLQPPAGKNSTTRSRR